MNDAGNEKRFASAVESDQEEGYKVVGKSMPRTDTWNKVTGRELYMEDVKIPDALWGKILRSPHPHAIIRRIDTSDAEKLPGVKAVITFRDIEPYKIGLAEFADQYALCDDRARYVGDEVCAVAALDEETAERAIELIKVDYEVLPFVLDPQEAMKPDAVILHEDKGTNIALEAHVEYGDTDKGFAEADHVFEDTFETQRQCHVCMEVHGCVASWEQGDHLSVWTSTQSPHKVRQWLAEATGLSLNRVSVNRVGVGGAFGSRTDIFPVDVITSYLSRKSGRPVKLLFSRQEEFTATVVRHPSIITIKTGVKDGKITTRHVTAIIDGGAYTAQTDGVLESLGWKGSSYYRIENYKYDGYGVLTNTAVSSAYRGYGGPQVGFALESQIDMIAEKLGLDPVEFRLNNANRQGDVTVAGSLLGSCGLSECIEQAADKLGRDGAKSGDAGFGVATGFGESGMRGVYYNNSDVSTAAVKMNVDGSVDVIAGGVEIGVGYDTAMAQVTAEIMGVPYDCVTVHSGDSDAAAYDLGQYANRGSLFTAKAIEMAAEKLKHQLLQSASELLSVPEQKLRIGNQRIYSADNPAASLPLADVAEHIYEAKGDAMIATAVFNPDTHLADENGYFKPPGCAVAYPVCAVALDVEVDEETGEFEIGKIVAAVDCGTVINPSLTEGQVEGDLHHGLGLATVEPGLRYDEEGKPYYHHLVDYKLLTAADMPPIETVLVQTYDPAGPLGIKGVSQIVTSTVSASLANAIYDAVGVRIRDLPITPEKILAALKEKKEA